MGENVEVTVQNLWSEQEERSVREPGLDIEDTVEQVKTNSGSDRRVIGFHQHSTISFVILKISIHQFTYSL